MAKYTVAITERLMRFVDVEADSPEDACDIVEDEYRAQVHILEAEDFVDVNFAIKENNN